MSDIPAVTVTQLHDLVASGQRVYLLDVRTEEEFRAERLRFTDDRIPYDSLSFYVERLPRDKSTPIYTFCRAGRRSGIAADFLKSIGYENVYNVAGGILAWKEAGYETVTGE